MEKQEKNTWKKVNHGGQKMAKVQDKKQYAVFIGRYQPYHYGHINLVQQKLEQGIPVLIMVRDIEPDEKNPFTTEQTVMMIKKYHASRNEDVKVIVIPDIESVNFGRGVGYEVNEFTPPDELAYISATKIRESIHLGDDTWKKSVDESIHEEVAKYLIEA
jgi:cytidyltransferase-like protein